MVNSNMKRNQLITTAKLYYIDGLSQKAIAKKLKVSRPTVSRLLKSSLREGIVQIRIDEVPSSGIELGIQIQKKFAIEKVIVVPSGSDINESKQNTGAAAALYLESTLKNGTLLGIAWGTTLSYVVKNIQHHPLKKIDVIQMIGGLRNKTQDTDANALALSLASILDGNSYLLQAPFLVKSKILKDLLMDEPHFREHFEIMKNISVALVGLGSSKPELSAQYRSGHITLEDIRKLRREGAVGDICGRYIDIYGNPCHNSFTERMLSISLDDLKKIPTVIGIACGKEKKDIISGALKGEYIDILITDKNAALAILD
ncbi:MAG: sugar-binding transcriptional regulator [Eubacteriales bacterium]